MSSVGSVRSDRSDHCRQCSTRRACCSTRSSSAVGHEGSISNSIHRCSSTCSDADSPRIRRADTSATRRPAATLGGAPRLRDRVIPVGALLSDNFAAKRLRSLAATEAGESPRRVGELTRPKPSVTARSSAWSSDDRPAMFPTEFSEEPAEKDPRHPGEHEAGELADGGERWRVLGERRRGGRRNVLEEETDPHREEEHGNARRVRHREGCGVLAQVMLSW